MKSSHHSVVARERSFAKRLVAKSENKQMRNANWHEVLGNAAVFKGSAEEFLEPQEKQTRGSRGPRPDAPDKRGLTRDRWCANKGPARKRSEA